MVPIRPLAFHELLDLPFALIQSRIRLLAAMIGVAIAVLTAVAVAVTALISELSGDSDDAVGWAAILTTLVCAWSLRLLVRSVSVPIGLSALHRRRVSGIDVLRRAASKTGPLLAFQLMYTLIGIGVLLLGAPLLITFPFAVIWLGWLRGRRAAILPLVFDDESAGYRAAAARAKLLAQGTEWQLVGVWLYLRGLMVVLLVPLLALPRFVSDISGTHRWAVTVLTIFFVLLVVAFSELVESTTNVVVYADRRCRREAWDIRWPGVNAS